MLKNTQNISLVVSKDLCTGCGVCQNVCPSDAITINLKKGIFVPEINDSVCTSCGMCYRICAGHSINLISNAKKLFNEKNVKTDYYIGQYIACYSGYSNNHDIRLHSASGGVLSQFLIYLLEKN